MSWGAVATGVGSAVGGMMAGGGGGGGTIHPMDYVPKHLRGDFQNLTGQIAGLEMPEYYQGSMIADQNPWMTGGLQGLAGYGSGMGGDIANAQLAGGMQGVGALQGGMDFLNSYQQQGPNQFQFDQDAFDSVMGNLTPGLQGQFDAGARNIQQGFEWNQLPGLNMQAGNFGLQGSTKLGQQTALGQAMADQQKADFGQGLYTNALNQATSAGLMGGQQNLSSANQFGSDMTANYGRMASLGLPLLQGAYGTGQSNIMGQLQAGQMQQGYDQSLIDADVNRWNFEQQAPGAHLQQQLNMMMQSMPGAPSQGGPGMSPWEGMMQGAQFGAGMYGFGQDQGWWGGGGGSWGSGGTMADPFLNSAENYGAYDGLF